MKKNVEQCNVFSKVDVVCPVSQDIPTCSSCCCTCCSSPERFLFPNMWQSRGPETPKPSTPTVREGADFRNHSTGWQRDPFPAKRGEGWFVYLGCLSSHRLLKDQSQLFLFTCRLNPDFCVFLSTSNSTIPLNSSFYTDFLQQLK